MKVAEPPILANLQSELLKPASADYIVKSVEKEIRKALAQPKDRRGATQQVLDKERQKLKNLIVAIEDGDAPATLLKAVKEREATIKRLEAQEGGDTEDGGCPAEGHCALGSGAAGGHHHARRLRSRSTWSCTLPDATADAR